MFAAMEWGVRPGVWFGLPKWERAAMVATIVGRSLIDSTVMEKVNTGA